MSGQQLRVATPSGQLQNRSPRARRTLADGELNAAEDTRHNGRLLSHFSIRTPLFALHDHNEDKVVESLISDLADGKSIALVSDAGTPLISDPGYRLVSTAHSRSIRVAPIAGASAATAALSAEGLPTDRFCFEGFLTARQKARKDRLAELSRETRTIVLYESVHRIRDCLVDLVDGFGENRNAFVGRELTKMHEQCVQATLSELLRQLDDGTIVAKGEFVIIVTGADDEQTYSLDVDRLLIELSEHLPGKDIAKLVARVTGESRNSLYERLLHLRDRE